MYIYTKLLMGKRQHHEPKKYRDYIRVDYGDL